MLLSAIVAVAVVPTRTVSADTTSDGWEYSINNGTITITGYSGPGGDVFIPDTIDGMPVTSIGARAFEGCFGLFNVFMGNHVTSIGQYAFANCPDLLAVRIPNSVTSIDDHAFAGSYYLDYVTIPNSVTSIGSYAFAGCVCLDHLTIGNSVTSISDYAFAGCANLDPLTIPNSVTSIDDHAFEGCNLVSIKFEGNAPSVGDSWATGGSLIWPTIYYNPGASGFSTPVWQGLPAYPVGTLTDSLGGTGPQLGSISGTLKDSDGNVITGAMVALSDGLWTATDANGHFEFDNVTVGSYILMVEKDGYQTTTQEVDTNAGNVTDAGVLKVASSSSSPNDTPWIAGAIVIVALAAIGGFVVLRRKT